MGKKPEVRGNMQENCSHSFNGDGECEYCGLTEQEYSESCMEGEEVGTYE